MVRRTVRFAAAFALCAILPCDSARAVDLESVLREVAAENPSLAAGRAMAESARHRVGPAGAWPAPMLEAGLMNVPESGRYYIDPMTMKMVGVSQRLPVSGSLGLHRKSAQEAARSAAANAEQMRLEVLGEAWSAYADVYYTSQIAGSGVVHEGVLDRLVAAARAGYEASRGTLDDVYRAEAARARQKVEHSMWDAEERAARARLDVLRGETPGTLLDTLAAPPSIEVPSEPENWIGSLATTHPRLEAKQAEVARYRYAARAARRMVWPDLELMASYGVRDSLVATTHSGGGIQENMYSVSVGIMLPVFAGRNGLAEGREMDAMARASEAERRRAELELIERVSVIHSEALAAQRVVRLLADTVVVSQRRGVESAWSAYRAGRSDLMHVFDSIHELHDQEVTLIRARQSLARAVGQFVALTGRGDLVGVKLPEGSRP